MHLLFTLKKFTSIDWSTFTTSYHLIALFYNIQFSSSHISFSSLFKCDNLLVSGTGESKHSGDRSPTKSRDDSVPVCDRLSTNYSNNHRNNRSLGKIEVGITNKDNSSKILVNQPEPKKDCNRYDSIMAQAKQVSNDANRRNKAISPTRSSNKVSPVSPNSPDVRRNNLTRVASDASSTKASPTNASPSNASPTNALLPEQLLDRYRQSIDVSAQVLRNIEQVSF